MPWFDRDVPIDSKSEDETQNTTTTMTHEENFTASTSLLWEEDILSYDETAKASMSTQLDFDEPNVEDHDTKRIGRNIAQLVAHN